MATTAKNYATKVTFMSIAKFKKMIGSENLSINFYEKTGKLSVLDSDNDTFYRVQQSIDMDAPMAVLLEEGKALSEACIVNVTGTGESPLELRKVLS